MFKDNLKALRRASGLTQEQVSELLGIERSSYTYYETGKSEPHYDRLLKIAEVFSVSIDRLLDNPVRHASLPISSDSDASDISGSVKSLAECSRDERLLIAYSRQLNDKKPLLEFAAELYKKQLEEETE